jgi:Na+/H+-dicarboxylate symporter
MKNILKKWTGLSLYVQIFIGLGLGIACGLIFGPKTEVLSPVGDIFLRLMKMVIVPVVFFSLISGTASLSSAVKLRRVGFKTLAMFLLTSAMAGAIGLILVNIIKPGANFTMEIPSGTMTGSSVPNFVDMVVNAVPTNIIEALANADMLQIICFAIFFGIGLLVMGDVAKPVVNAINVCAEVMYKITGWIMQFSPYAIFCIMAQVTGQFGAYVLLPMAKFLLCMYLAVFIHMFIAFPIMLKGIGHVNPITFAKKAFRSWIVAFSLCSSSATLPVTLQVADDLGVPRETASFVCPLGATTNMNGSCIYFATVVMFVAQIYEIDMPIASQVSLLLTAVLMSVGCAAIPNAALVLSVGLLSGMGVPSEPLLIVTGMYRLIDQAETSTNCTGDLVCAVTIAATEGDLDRDAYNAPSKFSKAKSAT